MAFGTLSDAPRATLHAACSASPGATHRWKGDYRIEVVRPEQSPQYLRALEAKKPVWWLSTSISERVNWLQRTKPLFDAAGQIVGVAATDVSLKMLNDFVRALSA